MTDVRVEQGDWEKAKRYRGHLGHWTLGDRSMFETLAEDFARHRQAAEKAQQERDAKVVETWDKIDWSRLHVIDLRIHIATAIRSQGHE